MAASVAAKATANQCGIERLSKRLVCRDWKPLKIANSNVTAAIAIHHEIYRIHKGSH